MNGIDLDTYFKAARFISELDQRYEPNRKAGWVYVMRNSELQLDPRGTAFRRAEMCELSFS